MNVVLLPLILVVLLVALVLLLVLAKRQGAGRNTRGAVRRSKGRMIPARSVPKPPLEVLASEREAGDRRRRNSSSNIRKDLEASFTAENKIDEGLFYGHVVQALDTWRGVDFTARNRAVGMGWMPFVGKPEHKETPETQAARLERNYRLNGEEKDALEAMWTHPTGRIAFGAGLVAARIYRFPAWRNPFFDERGVRVDLVRETEQIVTTAVELRDQRAILGSSPMGALRDDPDIVGVYVEKARILDRRADALMDRLTAFDDYRKVVGDIQKMVDKQAWLQRVSDIDDFEHEVRANTDLHKADNMRATTAESALLSSVYLSSLEPLTARLTVAEA